MHELESTLVIVYAFLKSVTGVCLVFWLSIVYYCRGLHHFTCKMSVQCQYLACHPSLDETSEREKEREREREREGERENRKKYPTRRVVSYIE